MASILARVRELQRREKVGKFKGKSIELIADLQSPEE